MFRLSDTSRERLLGVHPDLCRVVERAISITSVDFSVIEGCRTLERQRKLVAAGASQTLRSRHIPCRTGQNGQLFGHAVDLGAFVGHQLRWDWPLYDKIAEAMKRAATIESVPLEWGGDWTTLKDGPHFQLPWEEYPCQTP